MFNLSCYCILLVSMIFWVESTVTGVIYITPTSRVNCTTVFNANPKALFHKSCLASGNAVKMGIYKLPRSQRRNWRQICTLKCLQKTNCWGFSAPSVTNMCTFYGGATCGGGLNIVIATRGSFRQKLVALEPSCLVRLPPIITSRPTSAPIAPCVLGQDNPFAAEFNGLEGSPVNMQNFLEAKVDAKLCEMVRVAGISDTATSFTCSLEACVRWCSYNVKCNFVTYAPKTQTCIRGTYMELTDDQQNYRNYFAAGSRTFFRRTRGEMPYFSGYCNELTQGGCAADPLCAWNRGKRGYNDPLYGGGFGGYCGRIKCTG